MLKMNPPIARILLTGLVASLYACGGGGGSPNVSGQSSAPVVSSVISSVPVSPPSSSAPASASSSQPDATSPSSAQSSTADTPSSSSEAPVSSSSQAQQSSNDIIITPSSASQSSPASSEPSVTPSSAPSSQAQSSQSDTPVSSAPHSSAAPASSADSSQAPISSSSQPISSQSSSSQPSSSSISSDAPVSSVPASSSSAPASSSSTPASSAPSSSSPASSSAPAFFGNVANGETLYNQMCVACHGDEGKGGAHSTPINMPPYHYGSLDLFTRIDATMPSGNSAACVGQCAADITAFMLSWDIDTEPPALACSSDNGSDITYGARQLKLLTRSEYQNSVEDLVGINFTATAAIPTDTRVHGYSNNLSTVVSQVHQDAYFETASKISAWVSENNRWNTIVNCNLSSKTECLNDFVNNFAKKALRRPLTKGEIAAYTSLFGDNFTDGDVKAGLEMALTATLMSPGFLYRSEQGAPVSVGEHDGNGYEFIVVTEALTATNFGDKRHFTTGSVSGALIMGDTTNSLQQSKLGKHFSYSGDGTLMQFTVRGLLNEGNIPILKYGVGSFSGSFAVDWEDVRTLTLYFPGLTGHSEFAFYVDPGAAQVEIQTFSYGPGKPKANAPDPDAYVLTPYEVATYLAYTFTGSTPDAILMAAADANQLDTDEQISAQVERLLSTPRAKQRLGDFAAQWAGTDLALTQPKDIMAYSEDDINDTLRSAMAQEVRELFAHAALSGNSFKEFFSTNYAFVNKPLAEHYNLSGANSDTLFSKVNGNGQRGGIFTTGAFHVAYGAFEETHPIIRAARVREKFLCQHVPPPPAGVAVGRDLAEKRIAEIIAQQGYVTTRDKTHLLTNTDGCNSCHEKIINPLGFGLEDYDTVGRYQQQDRHGAPIDASGILYGITGLPNVDPSQHSFYGGKGLGELLANSDVAYQCFVENAFRFAMGVGSDVIDVNNPSGASLTAQEKADNSCSVQGITELMIQSDHDPRVALKSLGTMKLVRYRKEMNR